MRLRDSIGGSVTQLNVPFVTIPSILPPVTRRPPRTFAALDTAAGNAAAIGRDADGAALFDA